jgi:hypothetical protein
MKETITHWTCPSCETVISGSENDTRASLARQIGGSVDDFAPWRESLVCSCGNHMKAEDEEVDVEPKPMSTLDLIMQVESEGFDTRDPAQVAALQEMVDTGLVWKLQGAWQRFASEMIKAKVVKFNQKAKIGAS